MISKRDRLEELLVLQATQSLSANERAELEALLASEGSPSIELFDRAAAAIHVALMRPRQTLPATLRARLERQAASHFAQRDTSPSD